MSIEIVQRIDEIQTQQDELKNRLTEIAVLALNLVVEDEESFKKITGLYAEAKKWEKQIEFTRKLANEPDQSRINARNDRAKELLFPLKQIQEIANSKTVAYQAILEQKKVQEEEKIKEAADLLGIEEVPYINPLEKSIRGNGAIAYTRTVRNFRTTDLSKVPLKYLQINEDAVNQDIKLGVSEIPGIEIYESKITQLKTR